MSQIKFGSVQWEDLVQVGPVSLTTDVSGVLPVANGGSGSGSFTDGQLLIGNTTGNTLTKATLTGTANQVIVTNGHSSITLSLPQDIGTSSTPTFSTLTLSSQLDTPSIVHSGTISITPTSGNDVDINTAAGAYLHVTSTLGGGIKLERSTVNDAGTSLVFDTGGSSKWALGPQGDGTENFKLFNTTTTGTAFSVDNATNVMNIAALTATNAVLTTPNIGAATGTSLALTGTSVPAAAADTAYWGAYDWAAGDRRAGLRTELGTLMTFGNDRINFGSSTGYIAVGGNDTFQIQSGLMTFNNLSIGNDVSSSIFKMLGGADATLGPLNFVCGAHPSATGGNRYAYLGAADTGAMRLICLNTNGTTGFGKCSIGIASPTAWLSVLGTTEQIRASYDATNYFSTTVNSTANATFALTASSGTPVFTFSNSIAMAVLITKYNNISTVSGGIPAEYATVDLTGQTANIGATTLYAVPSTGAGMYRVSAYVVMTTAASVSSTLPNVQIVYTDKDANVSVTLDATPILAAAGLGQTGALTANTVGTAVSGVIVVNAKASTTIQYALVNYASSLAGMAYAVHLKLEAM